MFKIIYGGFSQETNTFSPLICKWENFVASGTLFGEDVIRTCYGKKDHVSGMLNYLVDAKDTTIIPTAMYRAASYGRVEQSICEQFIDIVCKAIKDNAPVDGVFLTLHGGMALTEEDDGIGLILEKIRETAGEDCVIASSSDLHANITHKVMKNVDILTGFHEYPHTDIYETGLRAAKLGMQALRTGVKPAMACAKIPMILQAEASTTKEGPLHTLIQDAEAVQANGEIIDFSIYHMQPWFDCREAGAAAVVIAQTPERARQYANEFASRFFGLRKVLQYNPMSVDQGLDLAAGHKTGELVVLSDAADNTSGGATGDSVVVLRRILERKLDIRAACVVADPPAVEQAIALGEGAVAEFTIGGKLDPLRQQPVTFTGTVTKICDPVVVETVGHKTGLSISFGKVAIVRVRNVDVILCIYPQLNFSPDQFTGFGLKFDDYDMVLVKSSLAYRDRFKDITSQMHNINTPGSTTSDLVSLGFTRIPRPMFPFDDVSDGALPAAYDARK